MWSRWFCKEFSSDIITLKYNQLQGNIKRRNRSCRLSDSEIITIMIGLHLGAHKTVKHYYNQIVIIHMLDLFPNIVSYNCFVRLQQRGLVVLSLFLKHKMWKCTDPSFIDSTILKVCRNQRIHSHKFFHGLSKRVKGSMGWFYGFKLHLVCNEKGELLSFYLTQGNVDDRNPKHINFVW